MPSSMAQIIYARLLNELMYDLVICCRDVVEQHYSRPRDLDGANYLTTHYPFRVCSSTEFTCWRTIQSFTYRANHSVVESRHAEDLEGSFRQSSSACQSYVVDDRTLIIRASIRGVLFPLLAIQPINGQGSSVSQPQLKAGLGRRRKSTILPTHTNEDLLIIGDHGAIPIAQKVIIYIYYLDLINFDSITVLLQLLIFSSIVLLYLSPFSERLL